jgi:adenine-specific DNA-methyltransferase
MQLNAEDGGNRKFIMVQLPEVCDEKSEAYKAGYKTICEIGEERIRRAGAKIKSENPTAQVDTGFRVLKLDSSNMQDVYYNPNAMRQSLLDETIDNVKTDRTPLDLLFQVMLDLGVELSAKIEEKQVNGKTYFVVNGNDLIACFDEDIDNAVITEIAKQQPLYAVFKSTSFATDSASINNEQLFKTYSPATVIKVI